MTVISARYPFTMSVAVEKLTEEFTVLVMDIKVINEKLEMGYQINDFLAIFRSV